MGSFDFHSEVPGTSPVIFHELWNSLLSITMIISEHQPVIFESINNN